MKISYLAVYHKSQYGVKNPRIKGQLCILLKKIVENHCHYQQKEKVLLSRRKDQQKLYEVSFSLG